MTEALALEVLKSKIQELDSKRSYYIRYRHFQLSAGKIKLLKAPNQLFALVNADAELRCFSNLGIYDLKDATISEMQYLHSGLITIQNLSLKATIQVKFIQAIFQQK
ncbi:MAG: hypothetical protein HYZ43_12295 [Flavobacteriia bacterium]|nr:hypothetical protein [Flavobacteriia bacterium]